MTTVNKAKHVILNVQGLVADNTIRVGINHNGINIVLYKQIIPTSFYIFKFYKICTYTNTGWSK